MYTHSKRSHAHVKGPVVDVRVRRVVEMYTKNNQACTKVSVPLKCCVEVGHSDYTEEEPSNRQAHLARCQRQLPKPERALCLQVEVSVTAS